MNPTIVICMLIAAWIGYGVLHSAMASFQAKNWVAAQFPYLMPYYRILFNLASLVGLIPILYLTLALPSVSLWRWEGIFYWVSLVSALAAVAGFIWSFRYYDIYEFIGIRQLHEKSSTPDIGKFRLSPLHRFVRHPWYSLSLLIIWTRDMNVLLLVSSVMATIYFISGSRMEEKKLHALYGEAYVEYCKRVPALFPLPWRILRNNEKKELTSDNQAGNME